MNILYITYDGITDHIGQSQVAPYLFGLSAKGYSITLLSAEKVERKDIIESYEKQFAAAGIEWQIVPYHKKPAVLSTVLDVYRMRKKAASLIARKRITVIHCRSYVASLVGLWFKKKSAVRFIFDMRDFWADAGKEIRRFNVESNAIHRVVYNFFKRKEKQFIEHADHIISLTAAGKKIIESWDHEGLVNLKAPITVIPCCADFDVFDRNKLDRDKLSRQRKELGLNGSDFVLNYLGSLGPTYLTDEMFDVFTVLLEKKPSAKFLIVANNDHHLAEQAAKRKGIDSSKIILLKGSKQDIPYLIAQSDLSIFFIIPSFAKQACSPTKLAELLAMNIPVIANTGVGDLDVLLDLEKNHSTVVKNFDKHEYEMVLEKVLQKAHNGHDQIRNNSKFCSLEKGIELYDQVYRSLK
jgi:glycosyltransferase involved in cell wall biosynthesis